MAGWLQEHLPDPGCFLLSDATETIMGQGHSLASILEGVYDGTYG